jgi:peptidoglycan/LPS O-acetylase OafA/YrhL
MKAASKTYFPNLDASRFFAFLPVFFTHVFFTNNPEIKSTIAYQFIENHLRVGILGLDYFFVLSSFLITWVILEEYERNASFSFKNYFVRRSLRIWPLYFLVVFATYLGAYFFSYEQLPPIHVFLLFYANFYFIEQGDSYLFLLVILWSVSVEEQFYLAWALVLKFLKKYLVPIAVVLILVSLLFRWYIIDQQHKLYFHTLSTLANFSMGALLAYCAFHKNQVFTFLKDMTRPQIGSIYFLFFLNVIFYKDLYSGPTMQIMERFIFSLFFAFIIFEQSFCDDSLFKMGKWKFTNYFGNASFGLYCYHGIVISIFIKLAEKYNWQANLLQVTFLNPLILLAITLIISYLTYEFYEKRFLKLKQGFYNLKAS